MRRSSSWFFGLLLTVTLLGGCSSDASRATAPGLSLADTYRAALSFLLPAGE